MDSSHAVRVAATIVAAAALASTAQTPPTPIPGGANQIKTEGGDTAGR